MTASELKAIVDGLAPAVRKLVDTAIAEYVTKAIGTVHTSDELRITMLETEVAELRGLVADLQGQLDGERAHAAR